jgi:hypothetical protein
VRAYRDASVAESEGVAPLFCTAPSSLDRHARWGRPYFQQFFGAMLPKPASLAPSPCLNFATSSTWSCRRSSSITHGPFYGGTEGSNPSPSQRRVSCEPDFLVGIVTVDERNPANSCHGLPAVEFAGWSRAVCHTRGQRRARVASSHTPDRGGTGSGSIQSGSLFKGLKSAVA